MILNKKNTSKKYCDKRASCQVLGGLLRSPQKLKEKDYPLEVDDFVGGMHQTLFSCIHNLVQKGLKTIKICDIETYLSNSDPVSYARMFEKSNGTEWITSITEDANLSNYSYYYNTVKKMALLRSYILKGCDVSNIIDMDEMQPSLLEERYKEFERLEINDIIRIMDENNMQAKRRFVFRNERSSRKAGDNAKELRERLRETPDYGTGTESEYLNTITRGFLGKKFWLETRDTGCGKTRIGIKRLINYCSPYIWDFEKEQYIENPNGKDNRGLYLGTEMDLYEELEPMIWAFISGVEEDKIRDGKLTDEESERVDRAIEIAEDTKIWLEDESNYDNCFLWNLAEEYKRKQGINIMIIDYLELNSSLQIEYSKFSRGMSVREDQILLNLSENVKNIANKLDITVVAFTQTTEEARRMGIRDQGSVKGAKSLPNKIDVGIVVFEPTKKELEKVEAMIKRASHGGDVVPNVVYTIYKNRGNKIKKVKIWGRQNLGNMQHEDLFCTNEYYEPINIDKTKISRV